MVIVPRSSEPPECRLEFEAEAFEFLFDLGDPCLSCNLGLYLWPFSMQ